MPLYSVADVGTIGLVVDTDPVLLPPGAWTAGQNVRFVNGACEKMGGQVSIATPSVTPYYLIPVLKGGTAYWVYCGLDKVYAWSGTSHTNITRQDESEDDDYTGLVSDYWSGDLIQGVLVLTNGKDDPQMWIGNDLESLDWDSGSTWGEKSYSAKVIRAYKEHLVALHWSDGSNEYPQSVYWSNKADPLSVPSDWDYADPANEAGIATLAATQGYVVDGLSLRDQFAIYKEDAIHTMQYVGGANVMAFRDVSKTSGVLARNCIAEVYGRHVVMVQDDIIVHDGQMIESLVNKRMRTSIFSAIDPTYYTNSFLVRNIAKQEVWVCFTESGATLPSRAAIWNWKDNTWAHRDLQAMPHIAFGVLPSTLGTLTWNGDNAAAWDDDTEQWGSRAYNPAAQQLVAITASDLLSLDDTAAFAGSDMISTVTREGILLDGLQATTKHVRAVYPRATGGAMSVYVGSKFDAEGNYSWKGPYAFTPSTDSKVPVRCTGRFIAIRFVFNATRANALHGYDIEYEVVGAR